MDERENLPAKMAAQGLAAYTGKRGSLVARGLAALRKDNDTLYRQARAVFDRKDGKIGNWNTTDNPAISSAFKIFQQLADENYGKAYYPLSILYSGLKDTSHLRHYTQLALEWCLANPTNDDVELWCYLGYMYKIGCGVAEDIDLAMYCFRKAADMGNVTSMWELVGAYEYQEDWENALCWQIKAAKAGHEEAQHALEQQHKHGDLESKIGDEQVFDWYVWSAEQGHLFAQLFLAEIYHGEYGVDQNVAQAAHWYLLAAMQGNAHAQLKIGEMYWEGRGVEQDDEQAKHWLDQSADQGNPEAQYQFGLFLYEKGEQEEAVEMIKYAANQEYGPAQYLISIDEGVTFGVDDEQCEELFDKAFSWYEERVVSRDSDLRLDLALMHLDSWQAPCNKSHRANRFDGMRLLEEVVSQPLVINFDTGADIKNDVQRRASRRFGNELLKLASQDNVSEAIRWLGQAADLGDAVACVDLAELYLCGHRGGLFSRVPQRKLVEVDPQAAIYWFERGFQLGWSTAAYMLGNEYLVGKYLSQNLELAEKWLLQAANAGNLSAPSVLGEEYASGVRLRQDSEAAIYWLRLAAEHAKSIGLKLASIYLDGKITPRNFDEAVKWLTFASDSGTFRNDAMRLVSEKCAVGKFSAMEVFATQAWLVEMAAQAYETVSDEKYPARKAINAFDLGELYELGLGVELDMENATIWYKHAAELGNNIVNPVTR